MSTHAHVRRFTPLTEVFGCDLRTLALFRINLALLILADLGLRSRDLAAHYTDAGILPRADLLGVIGSWVPSLHLVSGSLLMQAIMFFVAGAVAVALLVGYQTRIATVASWVLLLSLQNRNQMILQGGDMLLLLLLFWGMFLPLGARFSVDKAMNRGPDRPGHHFFSAATVALLMQCMFVYFFSALLKSDPAYIPDGTAVYNALQLDTYTTPVGHWLLNFPRIMQGITYYVWVLELVGPFLIFMPIFFVPFRLAFMAMFITMHVGFFLCLEIGLFPFISVASLLTFTPPAVWKWLGDRLHRGGTEPIDVYYDEGCDFCRKLCDLLRVFLILPGVSVKPAQATPFAHQLMDERYSWVIRDSAGGTWVRWQALVWLVQRSPLFWPLGKLLGRSRAMGDRFYGWVADNRPRFSGLTSVWLPYRTNSFEPTWVSQVIVAFFLLLALHGNLATVGIKIPLPEQVRSVYATLRLHQNWNMFAPAPANADHWYAPAAILANGMVVDPRGDTMADPDFRKPARAQDFYPTYRWRKYLVSITQPHYEAHRPLYAQYLCRRWNDANLDEFKIDELRIALLIERTVPDYDEPDVETYPFWQGKCSEFEEEDEPKWRQRDSGQDGV